MEIKDIVEQQKLEKSLERSKKKQDDFTRKEFLKDCYKFWKEYKKVEHPYTWWLYFVTLDYLLYGKRNFLWWSISDAPKQYLENNWLTKKWSVSIAQGLGLVVRRNAALSKNYVTIYHEY